MGEGFFDFGWHPSSDEDLEIDALEEYAHHVLQDTSQEKSLTKKLADVCVTWKGKVKSKPSTPKLKFKLKKEPSEKERSKANYFYMALVLVKFGAVDLEGSSLRGRELSDQDLLNNTKEIKRIARVFKRRAGDIKSYAGMRIGPSHVFYYDTDLKQLMLYKSVSDAGFLGLGSEVHDFLVRDKRAGCLLTPDEEGLDLVNYLYPKVLISTTTSDVSTYREVEDNMVVSSPTFPKKFDDDSVSIKRTPPSGGSSVSKPSVPEVFSKKLKENKVTAPDITSKSSTPTLGKSASTIGTVYYRLTYEDLAKGEFKNPAFAKEILSQIDLRDHPSIFEVGKKEEDIYNYVARAVNETLFKDRDQLNDTIAKVRYISELVTKGKYKKAVKETRCSSLQSFLDIEQNTLEISRESLNTDLKSFNQLKAVSESAHNTLQGVIDAAQEGVRLFKDKLPTDHTHLLEPFKSRSNGLSILSADLSMQQAQLQTVYDQVSAELKQCDEVITNLISQVRQLQAAEDKQDVEPPKPGFFGGGMVADFFKV